MSTLTTPLYAKDIEPVSDHCTYLYAAAASRMGRVASALVVRFDASTEIARADEAVRLTLNLACPEKPLLGAIDCAIRFVKANNGRSPDEVEVVGCVQEHMGRSMPLIEGGQ